MPPGQYPNPIHSWHHCKTWLPCGSSTHLDILEAELKERFPQHRIHYNGANEIVIVTDKLGVVFVQEDRQGRIGILCNGAAQEARLFDLADPQSGYPDSLYEILQTEQWPPEPEIAQSIHNFLDCYVEGGSLFILPKNQP